jgi:DNA-directed RNA polymerase subunit beta
MYAYIDRKKKLPVTTLLRAIGLERDKNIIDIFGLAEEVKVSEKNLKKFIGRKLAASVDHKYNEDFSDTDTGEVVSVERIDTIFERGTEITEDIIPMIIESGEESILVNKEEEEEGGLDYSIIFNTLSKDPTKSEKEAVQHIYRQLRSAEAPDDASAREVINNLFFSEKRYDLGEVGRYRLNKKLGLGIPMDVKVLTKEDIIEIIKYLIEMINSKTDVDDIDHLSNRRVRTVGEQLYNQFNIGLARMSRTIRERMNVRDNEVFTPIDLINAKTISSVINTSAPTHSRSSWTRPTLWPKSLTNDACRPLVPAVLPVSAQASRCETFTIHTTADSVLSRLLKAPTSVSYHRFAYTPRSTISDSSRHPTAKSPMRLSTSTTTRSYTSRPKSSQAKRSHRAMRLSMMTAHL